MSDFEVDLADLGGVVVVWLSLSRNRKRSGKKKKNRKKQRQRHSDAAEASLSSLVFALSLPMQEKCTLQTLREPKRIKPFSQAKRLLFI